MYQKVYSLTRCVHEYVIMECMSPHVIELSWTLEKHVYLNKHHLMKLLLRDTRTEQLCRMVVLCKRYGQVVVCEWEILIASPSMSLWAHAVLR